MSNLVATLLKAIAVFLMLVAGIFTIHLIDLLFSGDFGKSSGFAAEAFAAIALILIPAATGVFIWRRADKSNKRFSAERKESLVLQQAKAHKGVLRPADLAMNTRLSLAEAEDALKEMHSAGYAEVDVNDSGVLVYTFSGLKA